MVYESFAVFRKLYQNLRAQLKMSGPCVALGGTELANRPIVPLQPQGEEAEAGENVTLAAETREGPSRGMLWAILGAGEVGEDVEGKGIAAARHGNGRGVEGWSVSGSVF